MKQLLIATRSQGKFPEIAGTLNGLPVACLNLNDIESIPKDYEVAEPAMTFEGNALIKAMTLGNKTGLLTLADDSGLVVDALGGRPGVKSARYAAGNDEDRYRKLLHEMEDVSDENRTARFVCVIAIYDQKTQTVRTCQGSVEGSITREPRGTDGFGYDPVFYVTERKKTLAEMTLAEKNEVSHRGRAVAQARKNLGFLIYESKILNPKS